MDSNGGPWIPVSDVTESDKPFGPESPTENLDKNRIILREWQMRMATSVHHTNPRSATLDFWRKTTPFDQYKIIQAKRRAQMNRPTR